MPEFNPDTDTVIEIAELDALRAQLAAAEAQVGRLGELLGAAQSVLSETNDFYQIEDPNLTDEPPYRRIVDVLTEITALTGPARRGEASEMSDNATEFAKREVCNGNEPQTLYEIGTVRNLAHLIRKYISEQQRPQSSLLGSPAAITAERSAKVVEMQAENDALQLFIGELDAEVPGIREEFDANGLRGIARMAVVWARDDEYDALEAERAAAVAAERARCAGLCRARANEIGNGNSFLSAAEFGDACAAAIEAEPADGTKGGK